MTTFNHFNIKVYDNPVQKNGVANFGVSEFYMFFRDQILYISGTYFRGFISF